MKKIMPFLLIINTSLFIISLAISITILFRPFYYLHINTLNISEETGLTYNEIKESYDDVLDYLTLNKEFSTGKLKYSLDGEDHFKDCKRLFNINFIIFGITSIILIIKKKYFNNIKLFKHSISFWSSFLILSLFSLITMVTIFIGFDNTFTIFHNIFFLGKSNWLLKPSEDEIIKILPQRFFMNCAILIISIICVISITLIVREIVKKKHNNKKILYNRNRRSNYE